MSVAPDPATSDARLNAAVEAVRKKVDIEPEIALILGSGLGDLADAAEGSVNVEAVDIPGYPTSTVEGHHGRLVFGQLEGTPVVFVQGRVHAYEGYNMRRLAFPVRLVHALGANKLLVTNSAGGIHRDFSPGTLMFITDHINFAFASPLVGSCHAPRQAVPGERSDRHLPFYDKEWTKRAKSVARDMGIATREGTYIWVQGPTYETKAEIRAFEKLGADAVGMSTVPEVIQAQHLGMSVLGVSTITNPAAGMGAESLDHEEVLEVGRQVREDLTNLVRGIVREA
ncbi:purine-nucleoside phosphorylase [Longibacter salinarum]|uniref:Purine nucleoside phosphorylase n=1 Tax=Longibacter salinarum TaxID=1850348 RepID=A0A2A8D0P3_9BACT|nr:purine-nucleoside phosphorylase [Longibacter salinarum]PEN14496.1 purine-nucleoside phosphorylase [Longibacter salinarum]